MSEQKPETSDPKPHRFGEFKIPPKSRIVDWRVPVAKDEADDGDEGECVMPAIT